MQFHYKMSDTYYSKAFKSITAIKHIKKNCCPLVTYTFCKQVLHTSQQSQLLHYWHWLESVYEHITKCHVISRAVFQEGFIFMYI